MTETFSLNEIKPNPWQPRQSEDPEHIKKIALSIIEDGLMQVPVGRWVHPSGQSIPSAAGYEPNDFAALMIATGWHVQLAFGHSRLAAYQFLTDAGNAGFERMPVEIRELNDEQMFSLAIRENLARKDLSPIEEATAMKRWRDDFGKTSKEIGELFGLSDSAVRNKMRLLDLPEEIRVEMQGGKVTEGAGRALLTLFNVPEALRQRAEQSFDSDTRPSNIIRSALAGQDDAERTIHRIKDMVHSFSRNLSTALWKIDQVLEDPDVESLICNGCQFRDKDQNICAQPACYDLKDELFVKDYLTRASLASGIQISAGDYGNTGFHWDLEALAVSRKAGCDNLRIKFERYQYSNPTKESPADTLADIGFPQALIICSKQEQFCTCKHGLKYQEKLQQEIKREQGKNGNGAQPDVEEAPAETPTIEQLTELAREERRAKREAGKVTKEVTVLAGKRIADAIMEYNGLAWRLMSGKINYSLSESYQGNKTFEEYLQAIGEYLASTLLPYDPKSPEEVVESVNAGLVKFGMKKVQVPGVTPKGAGLMEVLGEEEPEYDPVDEENAAWTPDEQLEPFDETAVVEDDGKWESEYPEDTVS